jgi:PST family polysaccharide transporter
MGGLAVVSKDVVVLLLGAKWESAGLLLSVLALRGLPHSIERTLGWLHVTAGRTDRWFKWGLFSTAVHFVALFCGLPFGPMGVVAAYVIAMYILAIPAIVYAGRPLGIRAVDVIHTVWRQFIGALAATGICLLLRESVFADTHAFVRTVVLGLVYVLTYSVIVVGVLKLRGPVQTTQTLVRGYLPARLAHLLS